MLDNGTEYTDQAFVEIAKKNGIENGRSAIYTPQQNGRERKSNINRDVTNNVIDAWNVYRRFWAEALNCAVYILHRSGRSREKNRLVGEDQEGDRLCMTGR